MISKEGFHFLTLSIERCFFSVGTAAEQATSTTSSSSNKLWHWTLDILRQISVEEILKDSIFHSHNFPIDVQSPTLRHHDLDIYINDMVT